MPPKRSKKRLLAAPAYKRPKSAMSEVDSEDSSYGIEHHTPKGEILNLDPVVEGVSGSSIAKQDAEINQDNYDKLQTTISVLLKDLNDKLDNNNKDLNDKLDNNNKDLNDKLDKVKKDLDEVRQGVYPMRYLSQAQLDDCVQDIKNSETAMISGKVINPENLQAISKANKLHLIEMFDDIMSQLLHRPKYKYDYDLMGKIHRVNLTIPFGAWCTPANESAVAALRGGSESIDANRYHSIRPVIVGSCHENMLRWLKEADAYIRDVMTWRFMIETDSYYHHYYLQTVRSVVNPNLLVESDRQEAIKVHYVKTCNFLFQEAFSPLASVHGFFHKLKPDIVHSKPMTDYVPSAQELNRMLENHLTQEKISFEPDSEDLRCREHHLIVRRIITKSDSVSKKMSAYRSEVEKIFRRKLIYDHWAKRREAKSEPIALFSEVKLNLAAMMSMRGKSHQIIDDPISQSIFLQLFSYSVKSGLTFCILEDYFVSLFLNIEWDSPEFKKLRKEYDDKENKSTPLTKPVAYSMVKVDEGKSKYTSLAFLFALVYHGLTMSDDERAEQENTIDEMRLYLRKSADLTMDESEKRLANRVALDAGSSRLNITRNIDPFTEGRPCRMIDCRCQKWTGFDLLQDERYSSQVYLFDFDTISSYIPDLKTDIKTKDLQKGQKVIMKVYNIDLTFIHYTEDRFDDPLWPNVTPEKYQKSWDDRYFNEIESYHRIIKYNNTFRTADEGINIPEIYRCGSIRVYSEENGYEFTGFFILMEYIGAEHKTLSDDALQRGINSLEKAGLLGISHNDITTRNVLVRNGQMVLVDFSHASLSDRPVDTTEDRHTLQEVWEQLRSKGMMKTEKENQA